MPRDVRDWLAEARDKEQPGLSRRTAALMAGVEAFAAGVPDTENPLIGDPELAHAWARGWRIASRRGERLDRLERERLSAAMRGAARRRDMPLD